MGSLRPRGRDEEPSLTLSSCEGTIVVIDLDRFGELVEEKGWSEYSPNPITGLLSNLVYDFVRKWNAVIVYGLDWERGTEEAVIEIPLVDPQEVEEDLRHILEEVRREGGSVTIVAIRDIVVGRKAHSRREAYYGTLGRRRAIKMLGKLKRKGGGIIYTE